jgi:predicted aspartyl protease
VAKIRLLTLSLLTLCGLAFPQNQVQPENRINPALRVRGNQGRSHISIPFRLYASYLIVVEGQVGSHKRLKFLLDTGATHSVLNRELAVGFGLLRRSGQLLNIDKSLPAEWVDGAEVQLGPIHATHFAMLVGDLRYFLSFATSIDAVIGLDLLRLSSFSIDFNAHTITFGPMDNSIGVPMNVDSVCLTVQVLVGSSNLRLLIDTAAPALLLYEDRIADRLTGLRIRGETNGTSMAGWVPSKRAVTTSARLGGTDLDRTVFLVKAPAEDVLPGIDGYFGTAALNARRLDFDFETKTLAWKR